MILLSNLNKEINMGRGRLIKNQRERRTNRERMEKGRSITNGKVTKKRIKRRKKQENKEKEKNKDKRVKLKVTEKKHKEERR